MCKSEQGERLSNVSNQPVLSEIVSGCAADLADKAKTKADSRTAALAGMKEVLKEHGASEKAMTPHLSYVSQ